MVSFVPIVPLVFPFLKTKTFLSDTLVVCIT